MALFPLHDRQGGVPSTGVGPQAKSMASILAIVAAVAAFIVNNAAGKFGLAILAVLLGLVGMIRAASPRVSGGILSIAAIVIAAFGLLWALVDAVLL